LQNLAAVTPCRQALVWGRGDKQLERFRGEPDLREFAIETTQSIDDILPACNLIVTTTPATSPLLQAAGLRTGTHITAVGSDTPHKKELDSAILRRADIVVADSIEQCFQRGEIYQAMQSAEITGLDVVELGNVISRKSPGRTSDTQVTVADLTGVAVQDIKIATAVYEALKDE
jgi:ornithine cyclodeaminase